MYADMENWSEIRSRVLVERVSRRQILRETGMHWRTLRMGTHYAIDMGIIKCSIQLTLN
jgi:hypothetical protein